MKSWLLGKDTVARIGWRQEEKGTREDKMVGWRHWLHGHEFGWTPGVGDGQGGLACCDSWGCKESDTSERLNWTESLWLCCCSITQSCPNLCKPMDCRTPDLPVITNSQSLPKPMFIELVLPFNHLILCRPLLLLPSIFPSIRVFSNESALCITWPKYWSFGFNISPSNEHPGLISFRMDWLDLLAVQWTLKILPQHHSSKASILWSSAFFMVQLTCIYDHWKNHSLD